MTQDNPALADNPAQVEEPQDVTVDSGEQEEIKTTPSDWMADFEPDLKNDPSITKFKTVKDLAKSYRELGKMIGKGKVVLPTDKSTPEEWAEFYKKVGMPDDANGYETPELEVPAEIKMREEALETFKVKAHELGLNKKQFAELFGLYNELTLNAYNQELESANSIKSKTETALRKEWGAAYDAKVDSAQKVINAFFKGQEINKAFTILANDKGFVKAMADIADKLGEDVIAGEVRMTKTPEEAQKELSAIMAGEHPLSKAFYSDMHPEHKAAVDKVLDLQVAASVS